MKITQSQGNAIVHEEGPAMVLAGPGSGKTFVITRRVSYLVRQMQVPPERILVITFTRAAAREMKERYEQLLASDAFIPEGMIGKRAQGLNRQEQQRSERHPAAYGSRGSGHVTFGTFHAIYFQILKRAYHFGPDTILSEQARQSILMELVRKFLPGVDNQGELPGALSAEISRVKNEQIPLDCFYSGVCGEEVFRSLFQAYQERLCAMRRLDFDDILVRAKELLEKRPDILAAWQRQFTHILVDEFQDINLLQYQVIRMLALPENNLYIVGDDDQSIYRFRGAKPELMLRFPQDYPGCSIYTLRENFRSTSRILDAAGRVISENTQRYPKALVGMREDGEQVDVLRFPDPEKECLYIVNRIRQAVKEDVPFSQLAVLTRTNTGGRWIAEKLMAFAIPFRMRDLAPNLYDHWIAGDILTYCRLGLGSRQRTDFLRVMNRPLRYINRESLDSREVSFDSLRDYYEGKGWMLDRLNDMEMDLAALGRLRPFAAVNYIRNGIGYDEWLKAYAQERRIRPEELLEIAGEIQEQARPFATFREWAEHIEAYRCELARQAQEKKKEWEAGVREDAVCLCTMHSAKGLEFEEVFLPDVNEGNIPYGKARLDVDTQEERRLFYVGMTRAKKRLHILYVRERYGKEQEPSGFLDRLL